MEIALTILVNGLVYGLLLFLMASGLTLILSLMGVLNFAHGAFFMLGAYFGFEVARHFGFWPALFIAPVLTGFVGAAIERWGLRPLHKHGHTAELLFTFALTFVLQEMVVLFWGRLPVESAIPDILGTQIRLTTDFALPAYKLLLMALSALALISLWLFLTRTRIGMLVEAARTHPEMVSNLGHNIGFIHCLVFAIGTGLAGLAGAAGGPILVTEPGMAASLGAILFVVIITGGLGSLKGAFVASLVVGWLQHGAIALDFNLADLAGGDTDQLPAIFKVTLAQTAGLLPYIMLIAVLALRPRGFAGRNIA